MLPRDNETERQRKIREARLRQPIEVLRRHEAIAAGRHTHQYYSQEELDVADVEAAEMAAYFRSIMD